MSPINLQSEQARVLYKKYHVKVLSLFGSAARGEATSESDVDLLVAFSKPTSLLRMVAFERELSTLLGCNVDLLTEQSLSPYLRKQIIKERQQIYAA